MIVQFRDDEPLQAVSDRFHEELRKEQIRRGCHFSCLPFELKLEILLCVETSFVCLSRTIWKYAVLLDKDELHKLKESLEFSRSLYVRALDAATELVNAFFLDEQNEKCMLLVESGDQPAPPFVGSNQGRFIGAVLECNHPFWFTTEVEALLETARSITLTVHNARMVVKSRENPYNEPAEYCSINISNEERKIWWVQTTSDIPARLLHCR